jgi:hypothetical protein
MPDNVKFQSQVPSTPPIDTEVAADVIDDVAYQRMKIVLGEDGEVIADVSGRNPLPVTLAVGQEILLELKKLNLALSILTDTEITDSDVS